MVENNSILLYICHIPPKGAPISFVCMYFASTKYILHVKRDSLLVEPFVLYQVLIAIIHFKLVRVFITVEFKLCIRGHTNIETILL